MVFVWCGVVQFTEWLCFHICISYIFIFVLGYVPDTGISQFVINLVHLFIYLSIYL